MHLILYKSYLTKKRKTTAKVVCQQEYETDLKGDILNAN